MTSHRKNTLVVDFSTLPKRPVLSQVEEFLKSMIKLDMADVKSIQLHHHDNCVFIELINASIAPRLQKLHHLRHSFVYEGVDYYVPVYVDGPNTVVKINDLPPQMPNTVITSHMEQYGKVISIQNDVWKNYFPGVPNGVRVLRMRIDKPLPSTFVVEGHRSYISYPKHDMKQQQRTPSNATEKSKMQVPSNSGKGKANEKNHCDAPSAHPAEHSSDDDDDDDDDDESNNDDDDENNNNDYGNNSNNVRASETIDSGGKRRLSTDTNNEATDDNDPKRPCSKGDQKIDEKKDAEWKVYQTRSRKKANS